MIEPVTDAASHRKALRRVEELWNAQRGSEEERELDALATLIDAYERRAFPIPKLGPVEAIQLRCEQLGWTRRQLEPLLGSRGRVSEILSGRRALTLPMIRLLHRSLGIPAEILISEPSGRQTRSVTSKGGSRQSISRAQAQVPAGPATTRTVARARAAQAGKPKPQARGAAAARSGTQGHSVATGKTVSKRAATRGKSGSSTRPGAARGRARAAARK